MTIRAPILSPTEQARIEAAIADLERRSAAELVVVVAHRSASHAVYPALAAACAALLAGWIAALIGLTPTFAHLAILQGAVLLGAAALFFLTPLGLMFVPAAEKQARAAILARWEFANLVNNRTSGKDGVLLFLSVAEHYVEIIADDAIAAVVSQDRWQQMVDHFTTNAKGARVGDSLLGLIKECGSILAERVPPRPDQQNELPDQVKKI